MINQISHVKTKTAPLPQINRSLLQARHIQAVVKERVAGHSLPITGELWSPLTAGPFIVPITRWIE
jgi:hypothetical protein